MKGFKHGFFVFPPEKTLICGSHCSIDQSCCGMTSKAKYRLVSRRSLSMNFVLPERLLNQPKATLSKNQSNRSISVCLLFLFCSCVFISRSYENRSILPALCVRISFLLPHNYLGQVCCGTWSLWLTVNFLCKKGTYNWARTSDTL